jgi:phage shock protein PspC (stress-responsive transcriptional regulator)
MRNQLDMSMFNDLLERLVEKLSEISSGDTTITEKSVIQIVNSLGEPEDIFSDITESKKSAQNSKLTKDDVKDFFKREFHRNQKEGVVLGVCAGLGETFGINPIWLRIGFIILTLAYGINFIVYIVLGILLPDVSRKEQSSTKEPMEKIIERQVNEFAEDIHNRASTYYTSKNESVIV